MLCQKSKANFRFKHFLNLNYCPLIWMFCSRTLNHRINRLHERALRIAYDDYLSDFEELLIKDKRVTIHKPNLITLATEIYRISNNTSPLFMRVMKYVFLTIRDQQLR